MSPVGNALRLRVRRFPALLNCTTLDWFQEWPLEALQSVSLKYLQEIPSIEVNLSVIQSGKVASPGFHIITSPKLLLAIFDSCIIMGHPEGHQILMAKCYRSEIKRSLKYPGNRMLNQS